MSLQSEELTQVPDEIPAALSLPGPWAASRVAVVVPTYNEATNLPRLADRILDLPLPNVSIIVADDNSPDGTGQIADRIAGEVNSDRSGRMVVIHREAKEGIGRAHLAGMREAIDLGIDFIVQMDADLSHQPEVIPQMLGTMLSTGAGVIIGSRYVSGGSFSQNWGIHRRLLSRGGSFYINTLMRTGIRDTTGGFKLWRREVLQAIDLDGIMSDGFGFQIEMNYRCIQKGYKVIEIPIHFAERYSGSSKINFSIQVEALKLPFRLRFGKHRVSAR